MFQGMHLQLFSVFPFLLVLMFFGGGVMSSIVSYLFVSCNGSITSVGEERANLSAIVYL